MNHLKKIYRLADTYIIARIQKRPSTAAFWYLPEPPNIKTGDDLIRYQKSSAPAPRYLMDYRQKLKYSLKNEKGIIVLPYDSPIGEQVNPEAAFQYALGLHDQFYVNQDARYLKNFFDYANYFLEAQTKEGLWNYDFDWFASKAPWHSALAQARGASVMMRAWLHSKNTKYREAAEKALAKFLLPVSEGGFLHTFTPENCSYFEEYPKTPTGVINGFMAALISIWELHYWMKERRLEDLWKVGIDSLQKMLPYYSIGWWSLYDLDKETPVSNVNSPRYHLLEMNYLQVLTVLSESAVLANEYEKRVGQYNNLFFRLRALGLKFVRKILYK